MENLEACGIIKTVTEKFVKYFNSGESFSQAQLLAIQHLLAAIVIFEADHEVGIGKLDTETGEARILDWSGKPTPKQPMFTKFIAKGAANEFLSL